MKIGPKYKIARRLGAPVFEKTQTQKFALSESRKRRPFGRPQQVSDYGLQLKEKQKARYSYALTEKVFGRMVRNAMKQTAAKPADALFETLERRLDATVTRSGLGPTRLFCRQLISHGHILVNGRRVTIPSYTVSTGDVIQVKPSSVEKGLFQNSAQNESSSSAPSWLVVDDKQKTITITGMPVKDEVDLLFDTNSVLEFYSR